MLFLYFLMQISLLPAFIDAWWHLSHVSASDIDVNHINCNVFMLTKRQREICSMNPESMKATIIGIQNAVSECKTQFADEKWNCTGQNGIGDSALKIASKESAYVYALISAGVSHALARTCAKGLIPDCGCGDLPSGNYELQKLEELGTLQINSNYVTNPNPPEFVWAGCSDNVKYGNFFGRRFLDTVEKENLDEKSLMNLHNNRVGRKLLAQTVRKQCKCHGVSGSCLTKTCWKTVPPFDDFARTLKNKYQKAKQVTVKPQSKDLMVRIDEYETVTGPRAERFLENKVVEARMRRATKNDLVFFENSPDYCVRDLNREILGPKGRECRDRVHCESLCCNRGWDTRKETKEVPCNCKFIWCCEVKCDTCISVVDRHFCR